MPGLAAAFAAASLWNPSLVALAGATGSTLGELTSYLAGVSARGTVRWFAARHKWHWRIESWVERRGSFTVMAFAAIPLPGFDVVGIAAGVLGYPIHRFAVACLIGRIVKFTLVAMAGFWAAPALAGLFS